MKSKLNLLLTEFPLPPDWSEPEVVESRFEFGALKFNLLGLCSSHPSGAAMTGSGVDQGGDYISQSYFELLERICIVEASQSGKQEFAVKDFYGKQTPALPFKDVFPVSPLPDVWCYSKSNGVALGTTYEFARDGAFYELVERDQILRSWYGEIKPVKLDIIPESLVPLHPEYKIEVYHFGTKYNVSAVFGFPKKESRPMIFGFGSGKTLSIAVEKATKEFCQRLGFLWQEEIVHQLPIFSTTPSYHQDYYLVPSQLHKIKGWLAGKVLRQNPVNTTEGAHIHFVDLTPASLNSKVHVVKALSHQFVPLTFGLGNPFLRADLPSEALCHPIA